MDTYVLLVVFARGCHCFCLTVFAAQYSERIALCPTVIARIVLFVWILCHYTIFVVFVLIAVLSALAYWQRLFDPFLCFDMLCDGKCFHLWPEGL